MLAQLSCLLPYAIVVPKDHSFNVYEYVLDGYLVRVLSPLASEFIDRQEAPDEVKINGGEGYLADTLRIDFRKTEFNRGEGQPLDPPKEIVAEAIQRFHERFRYVTRAFHAEAPSFPECVWRIDYRNDDGSELPQESPGYRVYGARAWRWQFAGLDTQIWESVQTLPLDFRPQSGDTLWLDAKAAMPSIGTTLVLAATSLEVLIAWALEELARRGEIPVDVWNWINDREDWRQAPTADEQFDFLLKHFTGHSLKEDAPLWQHLKNIKTARNKFVHEGIPLIGGEPVTLTQANRLVEACHAIHMKIREWLPLDLQWPTMEFKTTIEFKKRLLGGKAADSATADGSDIP